MNTDHLYCQVGAEARELRTKGWSWQKIGKKLKVTDKTAKKAAESK